MKESGLVRKLYFKIQASKKETIIPKLDIQNKTLKNVKKTEHQFLESFEIYTKQIAKFC